MATKRESNGAVAMVAVSSGRLPDAASLLKAVSSDGAARAGLLGRLFGGRKEAPPGQWADQNLVVQTPEGMVMVSLMPGPIPWTELAGPCATAWWWPNAAEEMKKHKLHFVVGIMGSKADAIETRLRLTRLTSAVVRGSDAVGVYWGDGTVVWPAMDFVQQATTCDSKALPVPLWVDFRVEKNPDRTLRGFTTGMAPLGFREIEVRQSSLPPRELLEFVGDISFYILNNRVPVKDGETMGRTADEKYKVKFGPSMFDRPEVMQLIML